MSIPLLTVTKLTLSWTGWIQQSPLHYQDTYFSILAFVLHLEGETEMALEYLCKAEEALKEDKRDETDFIVTYSSFAWIHHHLKNQKDMERYRDKVRSISREGAAATVHGEKGWSFLKLGSMFFERAKESFEKALELNPENPTYNMEDSAAVKQLRKTLALYPDFTEAMTLLAVKKTQESCELVLKALSLSPNEKHIKKYLVHYIKKCSPEESLEMIKSALVQTPTSNYYEVGVCYKEKYVQLIKSGRRDEAAAYVKKCIRFLSEAVRLDPSNTNAMMNLAEAYAEDQQLQRAEEIFTNLIQEGQLGEKDKQHCHFIYGRFLYFKRNDEDRSVEQYKEAYKIQVYSGDRKKAGERLRQVATRKHGQMSNEIWAFLAAEDEKSNKGDDLASEFSQKYIAICP
uniref:Uncharacterized protein n=1 Tax=Denticeps clupeoides TaxID=299321 RepID=A0AAY4DFG8_9TELE